MSHALLVLASTEKESIYALNLKMYVACDAISKGSAKDAIALMEVLPTVDLVICDDEIKEEKTADLLVQFFESKKLQIPIIVLGKYRKNHQFNSLLKPDVDLQTLLRTASRILGITSKDIASMPVPEFYPIPIDYFLSLKFSLCDVFRRSTGDKGEAMYSKHFDANRRFEAKEIEHMKKMGVRHLYIPSYFRLKFVNSFTTQVISELRRQMPQVEKLKVIEISANYVAEQVKNMNFDEQMVEVANTAIDECFKVAKAQSGLGKLIKDLLENKASFMYQHSQLITYVSFHIIKSMDWGNEDQQQKLAFVSFFHDILLEDDQLAAIHSQVELDKLNLTEEQKKLVMNHAYKMSEVIQKYPNCPMGVDSIIKQHHGTRNGVGFTTNYIHGISPLAIVFLVAEEFVLRMIKEDQKFSVEKTCKELLRKYPPKGRYEATVRALESLKFN